MPEKIVEYSLSLSLCVVLIMTCTPEFIWLPIYFTLIKKSGPKQRWKRNNEAWISELSKDNRY